MIELIPCLSKASFPSTLNPTTLTASTALATKLMSWLPRRSRLNFKKQFGKRETWLNSALQMVMKNRNKAAKKLPNAVYINIINCV